MSCLMLSIHILFIYYTGTFTYTVLYAVGYFSHSLAFFLFVSLVLSSVVTAHNLLVILFSVTSNFVSRSVVIAHVSASYIIAIFFVK